MCSGFTQEVNDFFAKGSDFSSSSKEKVTYLAEDICKSYFHDLADGECNHQSRDN